MVKIINTDKHRTTYGIVSATVRANAPYYTKYGVYTCDYSRTLDRYVVQYARRDGMGYSAPIIVAIIDN